MRGSGSTRPTAGVSYNSLNPGRVTCISEKRATMKPLIPLLAAGFLAMGAAADAGEAVKPVNVGKLNTAADELDPFTADNLTLYYASNARGTFGICVSKRVRGKDAWPAGKVYADLSSKDCDHRSPFRRKNVFYFATNEVPDPALAKLKNFDLYQKIGMQAPFPVPAINDKTNETHAWITPGGKEFYFSRKTEEGWKLYMANGPEPGPVGKERAVGFPAGFHNATLEKNALRMYLQGPLEGGRWGLFRSKRTKVGAAWSMPEPLTMLNNAEGKRGDITPCLSADGVRLYFASDRPGGQGGMDIWYVLTSRLK